MLKMTMSLIWFINGVLQMVFVSFEKERRNPDKRTMWLIGSSGFLSMLIGILYQFT